MNRDDPKCCGCEYVLDSFGNYVECRKTAETGTHMFVDEFWNCQGESEPCPDFFNRDEFFNHFKKDGEQDDGHESDEPEQG